MEKEINWETFIAHFVGYVLLFGSFFLVAATEPSPWIRLGGGICVALVGAGLISIRHLDLKLRNPKN